MMHMAGVLIGFMIVAVLLLVGGLVVMHVIGGREVDGDH